jgi:hypothetical protein
MRYNLFDNGINSLDSGVDFYNRYLHCDNLFESEGYGDLKLAVICIHNAAEILIKYILSKQNELLIYKDLSNTSLLEVINIHNSLKYKIPLHQIVNSRDIPITTISYNEAVSRSKVFISFTEKNLLSLEKIGYIRNKITHFGIYKEIDFYEVIGAINNTLDCMLHTLYPHFETDKCEYYNLEAVYDKTLDTLQLGKDQEHEYWSSFYSHQFQQLNKILDQVINDSEIMLLLSKKDLKIKLVKEKYVDASNATIIITGSNTSDAPIKLYTSNYPDLDLTFLKDAEERVLAYLDHHYNLLNEEKMIIYESKKPIILTEEDFDFQLLKKQAKFTPRNYDLNTFKSILIRNIVEG